MVCDREINPYHTQSWGELQSEKQRLQQQGLKEKLSGCEVDTSYTKHCCSPFRSNWLFKMCVAHERETPLNVLHLMQPLMMALMCVGVAFVVLLSLLTTVGVSLPENEFEQVLLAVQCFASASLLYTGVTVANIPSQEKLNVFLNRQLSALNAFVDSQEDGALKAERLSGMSVQWVTERRDTREQMKALKAKLEAGQAEYWSFRFKFQLLTIMSNAEQRCFVERERELRDSMGAAGNSIAEFDSARNRILPDGLLSEDELRRVVQIIADTTQHSGGILSRAHQILSDFLSEEAEEDRASRTTGDSVMIKRTTTPRRRVGPTRAELERATLLTSQTTMLPEEPAILPEVRRWSTKDIVEMIVARAQRDFPTEYEQSIKPWKDDFERTKQESSLAAAASETSPDYAQNVTISDVAAR